MSDLKPEALLEYLGFKPEEVKDLDTFKKSFDTEFGRKAQLINDKEFVGKIFGQRVGSIENKFKSIVKKMGVELTDEEVKGKSVEEIQEYAMLKIADINKKAMEDLEKSSKGSKDEQVKEWKDKYTALDSKFKDTQSLLEKTSSDFEGFKKESAGKFRESTLNRFKNDAFGKIKFRQNATEIEKKGFMSVIADKYDFDLDENEQFFIKDKKSGNRIPSTKVTGQFKTAEDVLSEELIANKLAEVNPQGGQKAYKAPEVSGPIGGQTQENQAGAKQPVYSKRFLTSRQTA